MDPAEGKAIAQVETQFADVTLGRIVKRGDPREALEARVRPDGGGDAHFRGIAELPQIKPLAQVPARLREISALPPVKIGIVFWIGRGPIVRFCTLKNVPLCVTFSSAQRRFIN